MFGKRFELFKLLGFAVSIDLSWLLLAVLVTWSLAVGVFPMMKPDLPATTYWLMGVAGVIGLFLSIVLHELSHSLVARRYGLPMKGITLFIFGGVAEMDREPSEPRSEFAMAIAGPAASVAISALCYGLTRLSGALAWPVELTTVLLYLAVINIALVAFNLIPAFPLDGGRVLRSALWRWKGDLGWATRLASRIGSGFGVALIVLGVVSVLFGNFIGGMWWFLIGMFLRAAAQGSYRQLLLRRTFEGEPVSHFMRINPVTVPRSTDVADLVENYVYRNHYKMFPVIDGDRLVGCVTTRSIRALPHERWHDSTVGSITTPCSADNTITPDDDAMKALATMSRSGVSRLMVLDGDRLVGVLSLKDLLGLMSAKMDLEAA